MKIDITDIKKSIGFAFLDSKNRKNLYSILLVNLLVILFSFLMALVLAIPFIGVVIFMFLYIFIIVASYALQIYNLGFSYEITEVIMNDSTKIPDYIEEYKPRFVEGLKIFAIRFIYGLILNLVLTPIIFILVILIVVVIMFGAAIMSSFPLIGIVLITLVMFILIMVVDFVTSVFTLSIIEPTMYKYLTSKRVMDSVFKLTEVWELIKKMFNKNVVLCIKLSIINAIEALIFLPFVILLLVGIYEEIVIFTIVTFILMLLIAIPIAIFNIGFNFLSLPYLKGKMFKQFKNG
jgi:hypothetical protein